MVRVRLWSGPGSGVPPGRCSSTGRELSSLQRLRPLSEVVAHLVQVPPDVGARQRAAADRAGEVVDEVEFGDEQRAAVLVLDEEQLREAALEHGLMRGVEAAQLEPQPAGPLLQESRDL